MLCPHALTSEGFESQWGVNYLSHFLLAHMLWPRLAASGREGSKARVVSVSSIAHNFGDWIDLDDLSAQ